MEPEWLRFVEQLNIYDEHLTFVNMQITFVACNVEGGDEE